MNDQTPHRQTEANVVLRQIGKPLERSDAEGKATGRTRYAGDYTMPGMVHGRVLRSELASARLKHLDASAARNLPGVSCVLTAEELPDRLAATDMPGQTGQKRASTDRQILVREFIRHHGEPLALIAAETPAIAEKAHDLIECEIEPLPGVYDIDSALERDAPIVTEPDNIVGRHKIRKGNVEKGFAEADHIIENTFKTQFIEHA
ncbi:uncharacterized protein METZ01_LOCUS481099, partial [marine metagenome]